MVNNEHVHVSRRSRSTRLQRPHRPSTPPSATSHSPGQRWPSGLERDIASWIGSGRVRWCETPKMANSVGCPSLHSQYSAASMLMPGSACEVTRGERCQLQQLSFVTWIRHRGPFKTGQSPPPGLRSGSLRRWPFCLLATTG